VTAPAGIVSVDPAEMTVRVRAGTTTAELGAALDAVGQEVALPARPGGSVGGAVVVGHSDLRRLGRGPLRDAVLEVTLVDAWGRLVRGGGPTVKNVTGYDLARVVVGSLGTLGALAEVVLRTRPRPATTSWAAGPADAAALRDALLRPAAVLWDGTTTWTLLEGHPDDVAGELAVLAELGLVPVDGPPALPAHRWSVDPARIGELAGRFVAEVGVGTVHHSAPPPPVAIAPAVRTLQARMRDTFDPHRRCNPGRDPLVR